MSEIEKAFLLNTCPVCNWPIKEINKLSKNRSCSNIQDNLIGLKNHFYCSQYFFGYYGERIGVTVEKMSGTPKTFLRENIGGLYKVEIVIDYEISVEDLVKGIKSGRWENMLKTCKIL